MFHKSRILLRPNNHHCILFHGYYSPAPVTPLKDSCLSMYLWWPKPENPIITFLFCFSSCDIPFSHFIFIINLGVICLSSILCQICQPVKCYRVTWKICKLQINLAHEADVPVFSFTEVLCFQSGLIQELRIVIYFSLIIEVLEIRKHYEFQWKAYYLD